METQTETTRLSDAHSTSEADKTVIEEGPSSHEPHAADAFNGSEPNTNDNKSEQRAKVLATFNKTVGDLIDELKGAFPELKESLEERYASAAAPDDTSLMDWFIANAQPHFLDITTKNEAVFTKNDATFLLPDINFSQLWKCPITKANKTAIWKYLHVMLLLVSHYQLNTHDFEKTFSQWNEMLDGHQQGQMNEEELHKMKEHADQVMKLMQSLTGEDKDDEKEEDSDDDDDIHEAGGTSEEKAKRFEEKLKEDPFIQQLENSKIARFAKELSSEIDVSSLGISPDANIDSFQDVFGTIGKNPEKLLGLVKSVGDKIQNKLTTGDLNQSELVEEAHTLVKSMQDSKAFKKMFKKARKKGKHGGLDPTAMFATMAKQMASMPGMPPMPNGDAPGGEMPDPAAMQQMMAQMMGAMGGGGGGGGGAAALSRMGTQERLRNKLAARQNVADNSAPPATALPPAPPAPPGQETVPKKKKRGKKKKKKPAL